MQRYRFQHCRVIVDRRRAVVVTIFDSGCQVEAAPNLDADSIERAGQLGYRGADAERVRRMTLHHDLLHTVLAEAEGLPWSPTLHAVAHRYRLPPGEVEREERRVLCAHRLLNLGSLRALLPKPVLAR